MSGYVKLFYIKMWFNYHFNPFFLYRQSLGCNLANQLIEKTGRHSADIRYCFMRCGIYLKYDIEFNTFSIDKEFYKKMYIDE